MATTIGDLVFISDEHLVEQDNIDAIGNALVSVCPLWMREHQILDHRSESLCLIEHNR